MPYELLIALRYLRAKRKQLFVSIITGISTLGIFLGVAALIIVLAVMNGFEMDLREKILGINAHIALMKLTGPFDDYRSVIQKIEQVPGVLAATPCVYGQVMLKSGDRVTGVVVRGISPTDASRVINLGNMHAGSFDNLSAARRHMPGLDPAAAALPGIVLGRELAKNMGLLLGDTVSVISPMGVATPFGMVPRVKKFLVAGIFDSGLYEYDATLAFLDLKDCQEFLGMDDAVTGVDVKIRDIYAAPTIAAAIENKLGFPYLARTWMEMNKNLFSALRLEKRVMFIILSLIVLVAAFNIISTLIMVVMEKSRDIAILKSLGATRASIMKVFIFQGLAIGVGGTTAGCAAGVAVALHLEQVTRFLEKLFGFKFLPGGVYYLNELPSQVNYSDVATIIVVTMLLCFFSTLYPSWRASRLDPVETLRYD